MNGRMRMPALLQKLMLRERRKRNTQAREHCTRIESRLDCASPRSALMKIDHAIHGFSALMRCGYSDAMKQ
jgi:hypothetical protein